MPTVVLSPSRRRQLDVLPPGTLRSSGMSPDDARWAGSTEPEPVGLEFRIRSLNRGLGHHCVAPEF